MGEGTGSAAALHFLSHGLAPVTQNAYSGLWAQFEAFCETAKPI